MTRLRIVPMPSFDDACGIVAQLHRHHEPPTGHRISLGVLADRRVVAVAIAGRPVNRVLDDALTMEVTRLASDGTRNACSMLYGAVWRVARAAGYWRLITYTQADEFGASPRAAGLRKVAELPPRPGWNTPARPRAITGTENVPRVLWEATTADAPPLPDLRDVIRDEMRLRIRPPRCLRCRAVFAQPARGRRRVYCSKRCRQAHHRTRSVA
ncbi:XF1762 family protein [Actinomadura sp. KC216]|uniref:XF1762 family protein n=1 Tax=Actinomadura sp. KC216 TaxID=2530370 RepID=UPI001A9D3D20|nr:XF1762 family protein [Actinomadura sp. KC216]